MTCMVPQMMAYERMLRKALQKAHYPAVVLMQVRACRGRVLYTCVGTLFLSLVLRF